MRYRYAWYYRDADVIRTSDCEWCGALAGERCAYTERKTGLRRYTFTAHQLRYQAHHITREWLRLYHNVLTNCAEKG